MGGAWRRGGGRDGEAKQVWKKEKEEVVVVSNSRLKREGCRRTKHDSAFSKWKILIESSDWENYSLGKDGAERYRIHNLPASCSCPGLYELGVANVSTNARKLDPKSIVVVYLGQAENVRARLQHYGRTGSHLEHGDSSILSNKDISNVSQRGPGLFKEIFSKGFSIMFRWAPMRSKQEAMQIEARLLEMFDYAWNRIGNVACRRNDILLKLDKLMMPNSFHNLFRNLLPWKWQAVGKKQEEVDIIIGEPFGKEEPFNDRNYNYSGTVHKFSKSRPILIQHVDHFHSENDICGVIKDDGFVCEKRPLPRRKRCKDHKGRRINKSIPLSGKEKKDPICCGVFLEDGSICLEFPSSGRKRCNLHKGQRVHDFKRGMLLKSIPVVDV